MIAKTYVCDRCGVSQVKETAPKGWKMLKLHEVDADIFDSPKLLFCDQCVEPIVRLLPSNKKNA